MAKTKINRREVKEKAVRDLVNLKIKQKKLNQIDFEMIANRYKLNLSSLERAWENFNIYGKPERAHKEDIPVSDKDKEYKKKYYSKNKITEAKDFKTIDEFCKCLKSFIFDEWKPAFVFAKENRIHFSRLYSAFRELDKKGSITTKNGTKQIFELASNIGSSKPFPIVEAVNWYRSQKRHNVNPKHKAKQVDAMTKANYEHVLFILKEAL